MKSLHTNWYEDRLGTVILALRIYVEMGGVMQRVVKKMKVVATDAAKHPHLRLQIIRTFLIMYSKNSVCNFTRILVLSRTYEDLTWHGDNEPI